MLNKLNHLKNYQIAEIYILIVLFFTTLYTYKEQLILSHFTTSQTHPTPKTQHKSQKKTQQAEKNNLKSNLFLTNYLNKLSNLYHIKILSLNYNNKAISLKISSKINNGFKFLNHATFHLILKTFDFIIDDKKDLITMEVTLNTNNFYNENKNFTPPNNSTIEFTKKLQNPIDHNSNNSSKKLVQKKSNFTLKGIINNYANINGQWYQINEKIDDHILQHISKNFIILKNIKNSKKSKIYLFDKL